MRKTNEQRVGKGKRRKDGIHTEWKRSIEGRNREKEILSK